MHPVEHLLYFSVVLIHWVIPSHPIHFLFNAQHTALTPAAGHHGFEGPVFKGRVPTGSYFHYLHHRFFNTLPLDRMFGTFRESLFEKPNLGITEGKPLSSHHPVAKSPLAPSRLP
jgi:sterol desaturase/sphingolipid hydroxylase (fatty acid hydroxylase superfamily)